MEFRTKIAIRESVGTNQEKGALIGSICSQKARKKAVMPVLDENTVSNAPNVTTGCKRLRYISEKSTDI